MTVMRNGSGESGLPRLGRRIDLPPMRLAAE